MGAVTCYLLQDGEIALEAKLDSSSIRQNNKVTTYVLQGFRIYLGN